MRNVFTFAFMLLFLTVIGQAQTIVSTTPANRNALIEEFTGMNCTYCPDGHRIAHEIVVANPGRAYTIAIHTGSYATGTPDYQTAYGSAIAAQTGLTGFPAGTVNRHVFTSPAPMTAGGTAHGRGNWSSLTTQVLAMSSPMNIAIDVDLNYTTRVLTVLVEVYYTGNSTSTDKINVALLQNNVKGPQIGSAYNPTMVTTDGQYLHQAMLRNLLTGQWGEDITSTTTGSFFTRTYTYTVPSTLGNGSIPVELSQLEVVAFVTDGNQEVFTATGATVPAPTLDAGVSAISNIPVMQCSDNITPTVTLKNFGQNTLTSAVINYQVDGGTVNTYNWTGSLTTGQTTNVVLPALSGISDGYHTFNSYTTLPNGGTDLSTMNDQTTSTFTTFANKLLLPVAQPFTSATFPPADWSIINSGGDGYNWTRYSTQGHTAVGSAFMNFFNIASGQTDDLILKTLDLSSITNASLTFWYAYRQYSNESDALQVDVSTNCGSTWTSLWSKSGNTLKTGTATTSSFTAPTSGEWTQGTVSLAAYNGNNNVMVRFRATSDYGNNLFVDDINITGTSSTGITTGTIAGSPFCAGAAVSVPYTISGTFNAGNVFTAQLSSASGSFASPVNIGTLTSITAGTISATIPGGTTTGTGYRIRVVGSNPSTTGTDNGVNISISAQVTPSVVIALTSGTNPSCSGSPVTFTATPTNGGSSPSYQWKVNGANAGTNATFTTSTLTNGQVVTCVMTSNATCVIPATATSSGITMTINPVVTPGVSIAITSGTNPTCAGSGVTFTATPSNGGTSPAYQWKVDGVNAGTNAATFTTSTLTNGQTVTCVMTSNATCASPATATSTGITIAINPVVTPGVSIAITSGTNPTCAGSAVTFTATPTNGGASPSYQWQVNGVNAGTNAATFTTSTLTNGQAVTCVMTSNATCVSPSSATSTGITMTINPVVTPGVSIAVTAGSNPSCSGSPVTFTATPTNGGTTPSYQWQVNGVNAGTNAATFTTSTLTNGQAVTCVMTSNATCASPATVTSTGITMTINPVVTPGVSIAITSGSNPTCAESAVTFTATPSNGGTSPSYQWQVNGVNAGTNAATFTTSTLTNGQVVTCVMTSNATCSSPATATSTGITMTINSIVTPGVSIAVTAGSNPSCNGSSVTFTATPSNGGTSPSYQWQVNGVNAGTNAATFTTSTLTNGQVVTCVMTSNATCASPSSATSTGITMTINSTLVPSVSIAITSGNNPTCSGDPITFTATPVNGGATPSYQWKIDGSNAGTNAATFTTSTLTNGQAVTCVMTSGSACASPVTATSTAEIIVVSAAVTPAVNVSITSGVNPSCAGEPVTFTATPTNGGTNPSYQWKVDGVNAGTNSATFTTSSLTNGQAVTCEMTSNSTCASPASATSTGITMTINPVVTPGVSIAITSGTNPTCAGSAVTFTATPTNGGTSPSYQWQVNGVNTGTNAATFTTSTLTNGQTVTCVMTSNATCASPVTATSTGITMNINSIVTPGVSIAVTAGSNPSCSGSPATFTATPANGGTSPAYQWKVDGVNAGTNAATFTTSTLTNGQTVTCEMTSNLTCASPSTAASTGITMTINSIVTPGVSIAITSGTNPTCAGSAVTFTATPANGGTSPAYQWKLDGVNAGTNAATFTMSTLTNGQTVTCEMTSNATCASPSSATSTGITMAINASVTPDITISLTSGSNPDCEGTLLSFTATPVNGGTTPSYQWKVNGVNVGTNSPVYSSSGISDGQAVSCVMTSNTACLTSNTATSTSITINVIPLVTPDVSVAITGGTNPMCESSNITFTASPVNGGSSPVFQWKVDGVNVGTNAATYTTNTLTNGQLVTCEMTSNAGCVSTPTATSAPITSVVYDLPAAPVITQSDNTLSSSYINGNQWYDASGAVVGETNQNLVVVMDGDYYIIYTDDNGCSSQPSNTISVAVGIEQNDLMRSVVAPNPTNGLTQVIMLSNSNDVVTIDIINAQGQVICKEHFSGLQNYDLNMSKYANGVYIIRVQYDDQIDFHRLILEK